MYHGCNRLKVHPDFSIQIHISSKRSTVIYNLSKVFWVAIHCDMCDTAITSGTHIICPNYHNSHGPHPITESKPSNHRAEQFSHCNTAAVDWRDTLYDYDYDFTYSKVI